MIKEARGWAAVAALVWSAGVSAKVHYLSPEELRVPEGRVTAVEVRAALSVGRIGSGRVASWSIGWSDSVAVKLSFDFRTFADGVDEPWVTVSCGDRRAKVGKGFDCSGGFNSLAVEWGADGVVRVLGGEHELRPVLELDSLPRPQGVLTLSAEGGTPEVADVMIEVDEDDFGRLQTGYSDADIEGATLWRYLDRENDPSIALPGGRYLLAQVGNDLVYLGGAVTNAGHWRKGMLKGRLIPTGYVGYSRLEWFDATGRRLADDCYAQLDAASSTLTLHFPALQASIRFAKVRENQR